MLSVEQAVMDAVTAFADALPVPFEHDTEICFFHADSTKKLYPLMQSPPNNIAFLSKTDPVSISKVGFAGELLILFVQSRGLSTCWYGHYNLAELERLMPHLQSPEQLKEANMGFGYSKGAPEGTRAICISPLGYYEDGGLRLMDRITKKTVSQKRKEIAELLENPEDFTHLPEDVLYALDLGRKAPSAANAQMWKFGFEDSYKTVTVTMPRGYRHFKWEHPNVDIGICACHVWLGLIDKGCSPKVTVTDDSGRAVWRLSFE
jgi:nitroreductase